MSEIIKEPNEIEAKEIAEQEVSIVEAAREITDDMDFSEALEVSLANLNSNQRVIGTVMGITPTEIQVDIGRKQAGFVPLDEYSNDPSANPAEEVKVGDTMELIIMKTNDAEGTMMLSKKRAEAGKLWADFVEASKTGDVFTGVVSNVVKGGVIVISKGVRVFIPASLTGVPKGQALEDILKTEVKYKIVEVDENRKRAVGSVRAVLRDERKELINQFWAQVAENQEYTGTVKNLTTYGAFVEISTGVEGMVHISELSWKRIKHPSDIVSVGDTIKVYVKEANAETKRISLGYKRPEDNPWEILKANYPEGSVVDVKIAGMTTFGAFAQIIPGIDGLIHISQITDHHIEKPQDVLKAGETVQAKITAIDFDKKRVSLSIRALMETEEEKEEVTEAVEETAEEEAPVEAVEETVEEEAPAEVVEETVEVEAPVEAVEETVEEEAPAEVVEETVEEEAPAEVVEEATEEASAETAEEIAEEVSE